jgi:hypothetical protein
MKDRDPLLDLWRGIALVDMTWVHLATYPIGMAPWLEAWIGEYTRFAAGAFVLISGMTVFRVFAAKLAGPVEMARAARHRLFKRALMLAIMDRLIAVGFVAIDQFRLVPPTISPRFPAVSDLILFRDPGVTGGLLFLYSMLLLTTPVMDAARRRFGARAVLGASLGIYGAAYVSGLGTAATGQIWPFPVAYWQILFVCGYLVSDHLDRVRDRDGHLSRRWLMLVSAAFGVLFVLRNGVFLGLLPATASLAGAFVKVPLSPAELGWYLAASGFVLTWTAWLWEHAAWLRRPFGELCRIGRKSLLVYASHLYLQLPILEGLILINPGPLARTLILPLSILVLIGVAAGGEQLDRALAKAGGPRRWLLPTSGIMGSAFVVSAFFAVLALQLVLGPPDSWRTVPTASVSDGADFIGAHGAPIELYPFQGGSAEAFNGPPGGPSDDDNSLAFPTWQLLLPTDGPTLD